jgi:hypothetical protein
MLTPNVNSELLTTSLYFFYIDKVYHGLETAKSDEMEWFLPGKAILYHLYRFFGIDPSLIKKTSIYQYYLLKTRKNTAKLKKRWLG